MRVRAIPRTSRPSLSRRVIADGPAKRVIEVSEIRGDPLLQLRLEVAAQPEERRRRKLHRGAGREICVGDDFQAADGLLRERISGPLTAIQASFICGRATILERPLSVKVSAESSSAKVGAVSGGPAA